MDHRRSGGIGTKLRARVEELKGFVVSWRWRAIVRWFVTAVGFSLVSLGLLYLTKEVFRIPLAVATLVAAEIATILRFFVTNLWVFDRTASSAKGLWQFHCANAAGFAVWWCISNLLARYGVHYMVAATAGIAGSMGFNILASFFWIWRKGQPVSVNRAVMPDGK
jgi:putative flippase GtrA